MRENQDKFSDQARSLIGNAIVGAVDDELDALIYRLERRIRAENEKFFQIFIRKVIGVTSAPSLDGFGSPWKPLSDDYVKNQLKGDMRFYRRRGGLGDALAGMDPTNVLGSANGIALAEKFQTGPLSPSDEVSFNVRGRSRKQARFPKGAVVGGKKVGGQFASLTQVTKKLPGRIRFDPMPSVSGSMLASHHALADHLNESGLKPSYKLLNVKKNVDRPILKEYFQWWAEKKLSDIVEQEIKR